MALTKDTEWMLRDCTGEDIRGDGLPAEHPFSSRHLGEVLPIHRVATVPPDGIVPIMLLLRDAFRISKSEARRLVICGAVSFNGKLIEDFTAEVDVWGVGSVLRSGSHAVMLRTDETYLVPLEG